MASGAKRRTASHLVNGKAVPASPGADALEALLEVGAEIQAEELRVGAVLELIVERAQELSGAELAWLILRKEDSDELSMRVVRGHRTEAIAHASVEFGRGVGGVAVKEGRTVVVNDYPNYVHDTSSATRSAIEGEGIVSLICAPMLRGASMTGALYVGNRHRTTFPPTTIAIISALANQASVAIDHGRLYRQLEDKNRLLERSFVSHRELTLAALEGHGIDHIGETLARQLRRPIMVRQEVVDPHVAVHGGEPRNGAPLDVDGALHREPIVAAGDQVGEVIVRGDAPLSEWQQMTLEHGATVLALELVKERAAQEVEWRLRGELLEELLDAPGEPHERIVARAARGGVDLSHPYRIMVVQASDAGVGMLVGVVRATLAAAIQDRSEVLTAQRSSRVIVAIPGHWASCRELAEAIVRSAVGRGMSASVGLSRPSRDFVRALRAARACLSLISALDAQAAVLDYDDLGPLRFVLDAPNVEHAIDVVLERLEPLIEYDDEHGGALLSTLRAYVEADGSVARAAESSFVHVSTLKYRLRRSRDVLGESPSDPDVKFELRLAFRLLALLESLGVELPRRRVQRRPSRTPHGRRAW